MQNVMIDLETLGTRPGSVILSIGAVEFDRDLGLGREFYVELNQASSITAGLTTDDATVDWWLDQEDAARDLIKRTLFGGDRIEEGLHKFNAWVAPDTLIWGNGAAFDNTLLIEACERCGVQPAWKFHRDRCYRTLKTLFPDVELIRSGTFHHALDDAKSQAEHACRLLQKIPRG